MGHVQGRRRGLAALGLNPTPGLTLAAVVIVAAAAAAAATDVVDAAVVVLISF